LDTVGPEYYFHSQAFNSQRLHGHKSWWHFASLASGTMVTSHGTLPHPSSNKFLPDVLTSYSPARQWKLQFFFQFSQKLLEGEPLGGFSVKHYLAQI